MKNTKKWCIIYANAINIVIFLFVREKVMKKSNLIKIICLFAILSCLFGMQSFAKGWINDGGDNWQYLELDGTPAREVIKSSGEDKYYLDENGYMVRDYLLEDYNENVYYFDDSGKMVKNTWVAVDPSQVYNAMDNPPTVYLYYFGTTGKAYKALSGVARRGIDGKKYLFNENGQMLSGWINEAGERYDENDSDQDPFIGFCYFAGDETDGVLREGWSSYEEGSVDDRYYLTTSIWFYFNPSNNKKIAAENGNLEQKKIINGHTYSFDENGVMIQGWDSDTLDPNNEDSSIDTKKYYFEEGDELGRMSKKEWVFAVPSGKQNYEDHDAEVQRWFYALGGGDVLKNEMRKINSNYYIFDKGGIMKTGLCIIEKGTRAYVDCIDAERTEGRDFIISRHYISKDASSSAEEFKIFDSETQSIYYFSEDENDESTFGKRKIGDVTVAFGDDDYTFTSYGAGEYEGYKKKKYYQAGIKLKADKSLGLGMVFLGYASNSEAASVDFVPEYNKSTHTFAMEDKNHENIKSDYMVLRDIQDWIDNQAYPVFAVVDANGNAVNKVNVAKKDKSNRYWAIGTNGTLINIYEVPIRFNKSASGGVWQFRSEKQGTNGKTRTTWIDFDDPNGDVYGRHCSTNKLSPGAYAVAYDESFALNFRFAD